MPSVFGLNVITGGLSPDVYNTQTSLVAGGLFPLLTPQLGIADSSPATIAAQGTVISNAISAQFGAGITPTGGIIQASIGIPIGPHNTNLNFNLTDLIQNPTSIAGQRIFNPIGAAQANYVSNLTTYTGSELNIIVDLVKTSTATSNTSQLKQLIECTTFTISIHREKAAVRAAGYINPKGFARGRRTIAGTLVLTQFTVDVLYNFLMSQQLSSHDLSKDTQYVKVDQLPPFNMTMLFTDEYGSVSYRRVLGVDFVTDGVVYSTNDMLSEQTISYMASDFTPLLDINSSALFKPDVTSQIFAPERTVQTVLAGGPSQPAVPATNIFSPPSTAGGALRQYIGVGSNSSQQA